MYPDFVPEAALEIDAKEGSLGRVSYANLFHRGKLTLLDANALYGGGRGGIGCSPILGNRFCYTVIVSKAHATPTPVRMWLRQSIDIEGRQFLLPR